jgi:hypothetical protein
VFERFAISANQGERTMTDNASDDLREVKPVEGENEAEDENDYTPRFIRKVLDHPQLLPREIRADFVGVFEDFEFSHLGRAKTTFEYVLVNEAAKLVLNSNTWNASKERFSSTSSGQPPRPCSERRTLVGCRRA